MTTAYTSLLGLALPVTGELSGTWGDVVNQSITSLVDTSVAGTTNVSADSNVTLTTTTGASNQARQAILLFSGSRTAIRTVTAPAQSKIYTVINATTGGFAVTLVGAGPTTGVTIANGARTVVAWNGSDFVEVSSPSSIILPGGTANGVLYLNGSKVVTSGTALQFDGTNLGLGVTPSAWGYRAFQIANAAGISLSGYNTGGNLAVNCYDNSGWKYGSNNPASRYQQDQTGSHQWYTAPSGTAGNAITFTQAMTLDASGNLLVGATSGSERLTVQGTPTIYGDSRFNGSFFDTTTATTGTGAGLAFSGWTNGTGGGATFAQIKGIKENSTAGNTAGAFVITTLPNGGAPTERARIDSSGKLLVGTTTVPTGAFGADSLGVQSGGNTAIFKTTAGSGAGTSLNCVRDANGIQIGFHQSGSYIGNITTNGTGTAYNTSSDYRLKNITGNLTGYKERLMSLQPKQGTWIVDGSEFRGFLAHEFANPYSASVTGEKDAVDENGNPMMQSMQASSSEVMADLVAMVNELITENASLKARLDAANL
jgi:hypothetical protein